MSRPMLEIVDLYKEFPVRNAFGRIAHETVLRAFKLPLAKLPFAHGAQHPLTLAGFSLFDSYHCSRYNTNTGVLTVEMFESVIAALRERLG